MATTERRICPTNGKEEKEGEGGGLRQGRFTVLDKVQQI